MRRKVSVIGAGNVGTSVAQYVAESGSADVVLYDIVEDMPLGKGLDLAEAGPIRGYTCNVVGTNSYEDIDGSEVVVVTAGLARKPGMSREDLLNKNSEIISDVVRNIKKHASDSIVIIVSNPLDIMTYHALKTSGFPKSRVIGQAGVLDSIRFRTFISMELDISPEDIQTMVMGGHGDTMVPLPRYTTVAGIPLLELLSKERVDALVERTQKGGGEIVKLLKTGSAYYAPAAASAAMVKAILNDEKRVIPASVLLEGEFDLKNLCIGVPIVLGANGVEKILEITLSEEEKKLLHTSAETYRELLQVIGY